MKILLSLVFAFTLASCAHHHSKPEHHHHAYEKMCAYDVLEGNYESHGRSEFKLKHSGVTYYFSSKEKMDKFKKELKKNIARANTNWEDFSTKRENGRHR